MAPLGLVPFFDGLPNGPNYGFQVFPGSKAAWLKPVMSVEMGQSFLLQAAKKLNRPPSSLLPQRFRRNRGASENVEYEKVRFNDFFKNA
jgi:hypothetical protein